MQQRKSKRLNAALRLIVLALMLPGGVSVRQSRIEPGMKKAVLTAELGPTLSEVQNPDRTTTATFGFPRTAQTVKVIFDANGNVLSFPLTPSP